MYFICQFCSITWAPSTNVSHQLSQKCRCIKNVSQSITLYFSGRWSSVITSVMVEQLSFSLTWPEICFLSLVTTAKNQRTSLSSKCECVRGRGTRSRGYHRVQAQETNARNWTEKSTVNTCHHNWYWVISYDGVRHTEVYNGSKSHYICKIR